MSSVSSAVGAYYSIKSMNASVLAKASLQKISQDQWMQQMADLLKTLPEGDPNLGRNIDIRI